jgi:hypothetical protein
MNPIPAKSQVKYYYADATNQPVGPLSVEQIDALYQTGEITLDTLVIPEGATDWHPYRNIASRPASPSLVAPLATTTDPPAASGNFTATSSPTKIQRAKARLWSFVLGTKAKLLPFVLGTKARPLPFVLGAVFGSVISIGVLKIISLTSEPSKNGRIYFKVYQAAQFPERGWFGFLVNEKREVRTEIIVDFSEKLDLAKDDRLEGTYVPTAETGRWNNSPYRIYKLNGNFKVVDPLSIE